MLKSAIFKPKAKKSTANKITTVDPYTLSSYSYANNVINKSSVTKFDEKSFYNSYIQTKDVISDLIDIDNEISEEDLKDAIEIKAYDELGLDESREYSIFYFESNKTDSDFRVFNVIAIDKERLDEIFGELNSIKYIDHITVAPFLMKSLYTKGMLSSDGTDCFVYFHKDDAFVAIYQGGEYLFSKSIRYSLNNISDTFSKQLGTRVDREDFYNILTKSGFQNTNSAYQQQLMKIFGEVFVYINDIILYAKRAYSLDKLDQIYLGTDIGNIYGIEEFGFNYINLPIKNLEFIISKNKSDIDPLHTLLIINAKDYKENLDESLNLSVFKRPPPFSQRPSGKLVKATAAALMLSLLYPGYQFVYNNFVLKKEIRELDNKNIVLVARVDTMKNSLKEISNKRDNIVEQLTKKSADLEFRTKLLKEIYKKKVSYPMKAKTLVDLFEKINHHNSKVISVENNSSKLIITVQSDQDKHITELMKEISQEKKYSVSTDLIIKDENISSYKSAIEVGLNGSF
jgi:hypothetical protein